MRVRYAKVYCAHARAQSDLTIGPLGLSRRRCDDINNNIYTYTDTQTHIDKIYIYICVCIHIIDLTKGTFTVCVCVCRWKIGVESLGTAAAVSAWADLFASSPKIAADTNRFFSQSKDWLNDFDGLSLFDIYHCYFKFFFLYLPYYTICFINVVLGLYMTCLPAFPSSFDTYGRYVHSLFLVKCSIHFSLSLIAFHTDFLPWSIHFRRVYRYLYILFLLYFSRSSLRYPRFKYAPIFFLRVNIIVCIFS